MKKNKTPFIIAMTTSFLLLIGLIIPLTIENWIEKKIQAEIKKINNKYLIEIEKIDFSIMSIGVELKTIKFQSKPANNSKGYLSGQIALIKINGINPVNFIFNDDFKINEIIVSNIKIDGSLPLPSNNIESKTSPINVNIDNVILDKFNLKIKNNLTSQTYYVKNGNFELFDFQVLKKDTLSSEIFKNYEFSSEALTSINSDSMYTISANGINYSTNSSTLSVKSFSIHPNYKKYDFTSRKKFQSDRIEAEFKSIYVDNFSTSEYFKSKSLISSYVKIGKMNIDVFRDKRVKFQHILKPMFQEMIYKYPEKVSIDSIGIVNGKISYTEHAVKANHPGRISFNKIDAKIYKITNDTIYKKEKAYFEFKGTALLMGKGNLTVSLKSRLFDRDNTFSLIGFLSEIEAKELNPMLERNAFLYASSGKIDKINFNFTANNMKAKGKMTMLYHGLHLAVKNPNTDDTTAIKERIISIIANIKAMNSNPLPGKKIRIGIIDNQRDPEKFIFNYCFKSILSGIKSSIAKNPEKKNK